MSASARQQPKEDVKCDNNSSSENTSSTASNSTEEHTSSSEELKKKKDKNQKPEKPKKEKENQSVEDRQSIGRRSSVGSIGSSSSFLSTKRRLSSKSSLTSMQWALRPPGLVDPRDQWTKESQSKDSAKDSAKDKYQVLSETDILKSIDPLDFGSLQFSHACPVVLSAYVVFLSAQMIIGASGEEEFQQKFTLFLFWNDPRLAGWPEHREMPPNIWRPECGMMMKIKNTYVPPVQAAVGASTAVRKKSKEDQGDQKEAAKPKPKKEEGSKKEPSDDQTSAEGKKNTSDSTSRECQKDAADCSEDEEEEEEEEEEEVQFTNPHREIPLPQFWNGLEGRNAGRLFVEIPFLTCDIDMLEDPDRMKLFPFDTMRFDFLLVMSGEKRLETQVLCDRILMCLFKDS